MHRQVVRPRAVRASAWRTTPTLVHGILDEALICHLSFVATAVPSCCDDPRPVGSAVYLHARRQPPAARGLRDGGLRCAWPRRSSTGWCWRAPAFHHSMNYRSVVAPRRRAGRDRRGREAGRTRRRGRARGARTRSDCRAPRPRSWRRRPCCGSTSPRPRRRCAHGGVKDEPEDLALPYMGGGRAAAHTAGGVPSRTSPRELSVPPYASGTDADGSAAAGRTRGARLRFDHVW
jgi:hypothetical protein